MPKNPKPKKHSRLLRWAISLVLLLVAAVILAQNWDVVVRSAHAARDADAAWLVLALVLTGLTYWVAAAVYVRLAPHKLRYGQTVLIEISTAFVNRLLPSGIGGLGVHGLYLYRRKHTPAEATAVVTVNNLLGMGGHTTLLLLVLIFSPGSFETLQKHYHVSVNHWAYLAIFILLLAVFAARPLRTQIVSYAAKLLKGIYKIRVIHILQALFFAVLLTSTYTSILFACTHAVSLHLSVVHIFIVFSIGMLAGTAAPTPGGLVGMEAGLFAGFVGYGVSDALAGATVLIYRLITYWLPLLPGLIALGLARRQKLL